MFGHEDILNKRNYTTTVKCISNKSMIYFCKASEFYLVAYKDFRAWRVLTEICELKNNILMDNIKKAARETIKA